MSEQFREYVTGTSFALTLSRRMIDVLCQLDHYGYAFGSIASARGLADRGLVEWSDDAGGVVLMADGRRFRLTEAGAAVIPLLKLAGLYVRFPEIPEPVDIPEPRIVIRKKTEATP